MLHPSPHFFLKFLQQNFIGCMQTSLKSRVFVLLVFYTSLVHHRALPSKTGYLVTALDKIVTKILRMMYCVQVNPGSIAERFGMKAGDAVLTINGVNTDELEHEQAKYEILRCGDQVHFLLQRYAPC